MSALRAPADPVAAALHAAWRGADPGPTPSAARPPAARRWPGPVHPLERAPGRGAGALLDLALAADPDRVTGGVRLRRVPSAGGRYPVEAHLVDSGTVWRYDPLRHALCAPAATDHPGTAVVLGLVPARTVWRYGPRALPVLLLDLGHAVAALGAAASACGLRARALLAPGPELARAARLPWRDGAVRWPGAAPEYPLAVVSLEAGPPGREADAVRPAPAIGRAAPSPRPPAAEWEGAPPPQVDGAAAQMVAAALARLCAAPAAEPPLPADTVGPAVLLERRSAPWAALASRSDAPSPDPAPVLAAAAAHLGADRVVCLDPRGHAEALAALAPRSCGQPAVAEADRLLLLLGSPAAGPHTLSEHVGAGAAAHAAWLAAAAQRRPARPVGCWIDTLLSTPHGRRRVLHALALGPAA
ncbi:hypothetical protein [Nocardiopsis sp. FR4]|uniref:hypothetical protein n=1 Tax=Nocardiopsis sp. FR4 TaxID=2605985 RepID=UPI001356A678|nr:hypothetical protein [Nocardiopsis sp. FR4]